MSTPDESQPSSTTASTVLRVVVLGVLVVLGSGIGIPKATSPVPSPVPTPAHIASTEGRIFRRGPLPVSDSSRIVVTHPSLHRVAEGWVERLWTRTDRALERVTGDEDRRGRDGDFVLLLDRGLPPEGYTVRVRDQVEVTGGSPTGVAWGLSAVIQLLERTDAGLRMPRVEIHDQPRFPFRGLQVDIASRLYTQDEIKELILLCHVFRVRFLTLGVANQHAALIPWDGQEALRSWRGFSRAELEELNSFAEAQGVTLVPQLALPFGAHALLEGDSGLVEAPGFPAAPGPPGRVHLAKEATYQALDSLLANLQVFFPKAPYIALDAAVLDLTAFSQDVETLEYLERHHLGSMDHLVPHFLQRLASIAAGRGQRVVVDGDLFRNAWASAPPRTTGVAADVAEAVVGEGAPLASVLLTIQEPLPSVLSAFGFAPDVVDSRQAGLSLGWDGLEPPEALRSWAPAASKQGPLWGGQLRVEDLHAFLVAPLVAERLAFVSQGLWSGRSWDTSPQASASALERVQRIFRDLTRPASLAVRRTEPPAFGRQDPNAANQFATEALVTGRPVLHGDRLLMTDDGRFPEERDLIPDTVQITGSTPLRFRVVDTEGRQRGYPWMTFFERRPVSVAVRGGSGGPPRGPDGEVVSYFLDSVEVAVHVAPEAGTPRYTLDGTSPSFESPPVTDVIRLRSSAQVRIQVFDESVTPPTPAGLEAMARVIRLERLSHAAVGARVQVAGTGISLGDPAWLVDGVVHPGEVFEMAAGDTSWVVVDLGRTTTPEGGSLRSPDASDRQPGWRMEGSPTGEDWLLLGSVEPSAGSSTLAEVVAVQAPSIRFVRFRLQGNPDGERIRISEFVLLTDSSSMTQSSGL